MNNFEKRRFERLDTSIRVNFKTYDDSGLVCFEGDAKAINISKTGMLLQTDGALQHWIKLDLTLDISGVPVHLKCKCMYCRNAGDGTYESGIHVLKINKKDIKPYLSFINRLEKLAKNSKSLRPQTRGITDVVMRISAEHKIINEYVVVLEQMMSSPSPEVDYAATILRLMKNDITTHFNIEENLFFKIGRATLPKHCGEIITGLNDDHKELLQTIETLIESLNYQAINKGPLTPPLKEKICDLMEAVKQHAIIELQDLFPLLEDNVDAKKMIIEKIKGITEK